MEKKPQNSESRHADKYIIRLPDGMRDRIKTSADEQSRSMNAQIVHMLQSYFDQLDDQVAQLGEALEHERQEGIALGLADPLDRIAILKVLLLDELLLLRSRVQHLGGKKVVLETSKGDLVKAVEGPKIHGTQDEQRSYFSRIVESTPLTALLSDPEIDKLADRLALLHRNQEQLASQKHVSDKTAERVVDKRGSSGKMQRTLVTTKKNRLT